MDRARCPISHCLDARGLCGHDFPNLLCMFIEQLIATQVFRFSLSPLAGLLRCTCHFILRWADINKRIHSPNSACTALEWDPLGLSLAIAQANSSVVLLWFTRQWKTRAVDVGVKVCTCFMTLLMIRRYSVDRCNVEHSFDVSTPQSTRSRW